MKKIKLLSVASLVVLGTASLAFALRNEKTVRDQNNAQAMVDYAGYSNSRVADPGEHIVCSGRCVLSAIIRNTGPYTRITVRNSSVAQGNGVIAVENFFSPTNSGAWVNSIPAPLIFTKGITVTLGTTVNGEQVTVLYEDLD